MFLFTGNTDYNSPALALYNEPRGGLMKQRIAVIALILFIAAISLFLSTKIAAP